MLGDIDIKEMAAIGIVLAATLWVYALTIFRGREVWQDLKGMDGTWQFIEVTGIVWLTFFPILLIVEMLGQGVSGAVWTSFDAIFIALIGGKKLLEKHIEKGEQ